MLLKEMGELAGSKCGYLQFKLQTVGVFYEDGKWMKAEVLHKVMIESGLKTSNSIYNIISEVKNDTLFKISFTPVQNFHHLSPQR